MSGLRWLVLVVVLLGLAACSAPTGPELCRDTAADYLEAADALNERWLDAVELAGSTPRLALGPVVAEMQAIQREAEAMDVPDCAAELHKRLLASIEPVVLGALDFLADGDPELVNVALELSEFYSHNFKTGRDAIMAGFVLTPTP